MKRKIISMLVVLTMLASLCSGLCVTALAAPPAEPVCATQRSVRFDTNNPGTYHMWFGKQDAGEYTFQKVEGGFTIWSTQAEQYVTLSEGQVIMGDQPYTWSKNVDGFYHRETVRKQGRKTQVKTYYLVSNGQGGLKVSTKFKGVRFTQLVTYEDHNYAFYTANGDGTHNARCTVCGEELVNDSCTYGDGDYCELCDAIKPSLAGVQNVEVKISEPVDGYWEWYYWRYIYIPGREGYTAKIRAFAEGTTVEKIEYSTDNENFTEGRHYFSEDAIDQLYIRVTDGKGQETKWLYTDEAVTKVEGEEKWWFDLFALKDAQSQLGASDVKKIVFAAQAPTGSTYVTWDAPAGLTAYLDTVDTNHTLTYVLKPGTSTIQFTDATLFTLISKASQSKTKVLQIANLLRAEEGKEPLTSLTEEEFDSYSETVAGALSFMSAASIEGLELFDVSRVKDFSGMFAMYGGETLDLSSWNTAKAVNMEGMFAICGNLTQLKLGEGWSTENVTNMAEMFVMAGRLAEIPTVGWNTAKVKNMEGMFAYCMSAASLDLSSWDTSKVETMESMFTFCISLTQLKLGEDWSTENVTNMASMFRSTGKLADIPTAGWNTAKVTNMESMFGACETVESLDLSSWNTAKVTNMKRMFANCIALEHIYVGEDWSMESVTDTTDMFANDTVLHNYPHDGAFVGDEGCLENLPPAPPPA